MLLSLPVGPLSPAPDQFSTGPALSSLLSYAEELVDSTIHVEINGGAVLLTGRASSDAAIARAIEIVTGFTSRPVVCEILVA